MLLRLAYLGVTNAFALLRLLPRSGRDKDVATLRQFRLPVCPETVLRWHRDLMARRHAARSRPKRPGRPRTIRSIRLLVLHLARENSAWGYRRIHDGLVLGIKVAASTVWQILEDTLRGKHVGEAPRRPCLATVSLGQATRKMAR